MSERFRRIVASLMIPCLFLDTRAAAGRQSVGAPRPLAGDLAGHDSFLSQALNLRAVSPLSEDESGRPTRASVWQWASRAGFFGSYNERVIRRLSPVVAQISSYENALGRMSKDDLTRKGEELRNRRSQKEPLDQLLPESFALVREAVKRTLGFRLFDVQMMGGIILHRGDGGIIEMKTGEGKTYVAIAPTFLNSLDGKGVHIVTVNDYLAQRDAAITGPVYKLISASVGAIAHEMEDPERREAYSRDVTFGTNNEFGFDYLRDNMKLHPADVVQHGHHYAIVDEVDSILIDEARTPLIIAGPGEAPSGTLALISRIIPRLVRGQAAADSASGATAATGDYTVDEKHRVAALTEAGVRKVEKQLKIDNLYDDANLEINHRVLQALRAHTLYHRDREYVVRNGEVIIVDEFTGRLMPGRRWSDGLHQAVEAKEGVTIERENETLAAITFQNYFRLYKKLSGMTGTALTEAPEFHKVYNREVAAIPTHKPMIRRDFPDLLIRTEAGKLRSIGLEIQEMNTRGQPVLVGTSSVEKSEKISAVLTSLGIKHQVLNAKHHEREAGIIAQAGRNRTVTVATNMAGRGTDILLGGNPEFMARDAALAQGLAEFLPDGPAVYEIDDGFYYFNHLGRSYRLPRGNWDKLYGRFKAQTDKEQQEVIALGGLHIVGTERHESRRIDNQLRGRAGRQGDPGSSRFFLSLEDDLLRMSGDQRLQEIWRRLGIHEEAPIEARHISKRIAAAQKAIEGQNFEARKQVLDYDDVMNKQRKAVYGMRRQLLEGGSIMDWVRDLVGETEALAGEAILGQLQATPLLQIIDDQWRDHLRFMDELKRGIGLRGYAQKDPLVEYKRESFKLFADMMDRLADEIVRYISQFAAKPGSAARSDSTFHSA